MACILNKDYLIRLDLDLNKLVLFNTSALYHHGFSMLFHCEFYLLCSMSVLGHDMFSVTVRPSDLVTWSILRCATELLDREV